VHVAASATFGKWKTIEEIIVDAKDDMEGHGHHHSGESGSAHGQNKHDEPSAHQEHDHQHDSARHHLQEHEPGGGAAHGHHRHRASAQNQVPEGTIYTCPMHPQIRQPGPGNCPICGMALEPEIATSDQGPSAEYLDMRRRFWIGLVLAVPVLVLEMGSHLVDLHGVIDPMVSNWIQLVLATPVVLWAGWPFFERAWQSLKTMNLNMFTLIAMGTGVAWLYSVIGTVTPGVFPATFRGMGGAVAVYFEAAAVITVLVLLGQVLELRAREQTGGAIRALLDLAPKMARRVAVDGSESDIALEEVAVGDRLRVPSTAGSSKAAVRSTNP
jgi:cation transport ATPase